MRKDYGLSEYAFQKDVVPMQHHFSENIDSTTAQKIASRLWKVYDKVFHGNGKRIHYQKHGNFNSLEGKSNKAGIRFKNDTLLWNGLVIPAAVDHDNPYEEQALRDPVCYCRIVRKYVRNRYKFYVQLVMKGCPPVKLDAETGERKHTIGTGDVGIDIGTATVAIASETEVRIAELADRVRDIDRKKKRLLLRKMDRSRRATNPDNYNEDGTIKKQRAEAPLGKIKPLHKIPERIKGIVSEGSRRAQVPARMPLTTSCHSETTSTSRR